MSATEESHTGTKSLSSASSFQWFSNFGQFVILVESNNSHNSIMMTVSIQLKVYADDIVQKNNQSFTIKPIP